MPGPGYPWLQNKFIAHRFLSCIEYTCFDDIEQPVRPSTESLTGDVR
jgi:hypothetical protein